jgi:peptidoglycan/xylan/chitin deacetylase (PgdA/CDA1 family)
VDITGGRRGLLRAGAVAAAGVAAGVAGIRGADAWDTRGPLPFYEGPAASIHPDRRTPPKHGHVNVVWSGSTKEKRIALTFDDGPKPEWTPKVLSTLEAQKVPATFFVTGENLAAHKDLLRTGHEFGNHTWAHKDLGRQDFAEAMDALKRTHDLIAETTGTAPTLMRPPYGHIGGSTMLASAELGYTVVLWSRQMLESDYLSDPKGLVDYIVRECMPGDIVLAHDTGPRDRLVAIDNLGPMISGLRDRGFTFVTVSQLLASD